MSMEGSFVILAEVKGRKYKAGKEHGACVLKVHCLEQWLLDSWSQDSFTLLKVTEGLTEILCDLHIYVHVGISICLC